MSAAAVALARKTVKRVALFFEEYAPGHIPKWWKTKGHLQLDYQLGIPYHRYRLTAGGKAQIAILDYILMETIGTHGPSYEGFSRHITIKEFAAFACLKPRAIQEGLKDLKERGVIRREGPESPTEEWNEETGWGWRCTLKIWAKLASYSPPPPAELTVVDAETEEEPEDEQKAKSSGEARILAAQTIRSGRGGKPFKVFEDLKMRVYSDHGVEQRTQVIDDQLIEVYLRSVPEQASQANNKDARGSSKGVNGHAPPESSPPRAGPVSRETSDGFQSFLELALEARFRTTGPLIKKAEKMFIELPIQTQIAACRGLKAQIEAGDYPNDAYPKQIDRYVEDEMWQAAPRRTKMSRTSQIIKELTGG